MKTYFTFGQVHIHKIDNTIFDKNCIVEIESETRDQARKKMFDTFGNKWAMQYNEPPKMHFADKGIIKLNY